LILNLYPKLGAYVIETKVLGPDLEYNLTVFLDRDLPADAFGVAAANWFQNQLHEAHGVCGGCELMNCPGTSHLRKSHYD
jgi:hypothetical protein